MEPIDIILVVWERPKLTEMTIRAIKQNTKPGTYNLIIMDNNQENIGLEAARQKGLEQVKSKYFVCVDNDILPQKIKDGKDWLEELVELMDKNPEYAAISARTQIMIGTGNIF